MNSVLLVLRIILASVFAVASTLKILNQSGFRRSVVEFGIGPRWARAVAVLVVAAEFAVALTLLRADTAWLGGVSCFVLLFVFTAVIIGNLVHGKRPTCQCFGQLHATAVGKVTVFRNVLLACGAMAIIVQGPNYTFSGIVEWVNLPRSVLPIVVAVMALTMSLQMWLMFHLLRQHGRLLLFIDNLELRLDAAGVKAIPDLEVFPNALPVGTRAPDFTLPLAAGGRVTLAELLQPGRPLLIIFSDPECGPCSALMPDIASWQKAHESILVIAMISREGGKSNYRALEELGLRNVLVQRDREVATEYQVQGTPSGVLVTAAGMIGAPIAVGAAGIASLVADLSNRASSRPLNGVKGDRHDSTSPNTSEAGIFPQV